MLSDRYEQELAQILKAGLPAPSPGCEARALAALADIRPRRHPNLVTFIIVAALLLLLAAGVYAAVRHFLFVEGTLRFHESRYGAGRWAERARFFSGELEWETEPDVTRFGGDISPIGDQVVFYSGDWPATGSDILVADLDWSGEVNLTEIAGISGVNCMPKWSPDGRMIAFQHADPPVKGQQACDTGFQLWVMDSDGSDAHQVLPKGSPPNWNAFWFPDGLRLLASYYFEDAGALEWRAFSTDLWGRDVRPLPPGVGAGPISPDGSLLVTGDIVPQTVDGHPGYWRRLVLAHVDGSHPRAIAGQFLRTADLAAHIALHKGTPNQSPDLSTMTPEWAQYEIRSWVGPADGVWSPDGSKIAFIAAMPFDPKGVFYRDQIEVWVYDLTTDELIRVTDDDVGQHHIIWK